MRIVAMLIATLILLQGPLAAAPHAKDIVLVVNVSGLTLEEAGDEPWLASPCLNPEHCYFKPRAEASSGETYPASPGGEVDLSAPYRFRACFLLEEEALGWRPWENHYALTASGAYARVADPETAGCYCERDLCRALARELIEALLASDSGCRIALCCVGGPFDTRFCVNFTRDEEKLLAALYAAPGSGIGDASAALAKAGEYIERRNADQRRTRPAAVVALSVAREDEGVFGERTQKEAQRLMEGAALVWASPLETDGEELIALLGFAAEAAHPPLPIFPRAGGTGRLSLEW
ncbi:MAG TPA: hypothetical protein VN540_05705 [Clostridia bacterium]|nr:hypothetical protein [Clostridia bacterium]